MSEAFHPFPLFKFKKLASFCEPFCVSIYIPMFKRGKEQNLGLSQAHLKSCLRESQRSLEAQGMEEKKANKYLQGIKKLLADVRIWRNPAEGLAVFLNTNSGVEYYTLPIRFQPQSYVSDHHFLLPLFPLYEFDTTFYLLELSQDYVRLHKGNRFVMEDLFVNEFAPERLEEAVGFDYEQKMLQFRSGHSLYSAGSFHGQGEGKDDDRKEITQFFREINRGVNKIIKEKNAPLILACIDSLYPMYKEVNTYPNLYPHHLSGDPQYKNKNQLRQESWSMISELLTRKRNQNKDRYHELIHTAKTSHQISEIVPAARHGQVATLFLKKGDEVFGTFNVNKNCVILDSEKTPTNKSLMNMAALDTFLQGGTVLALNAEDMPENKRPLNALFRY